MVFERKMCRTLFASNVAQPQPLDRCYEPKYQGRDTRETVCWYCILHFCWLAWTRVCTVRCNRPKRGDRLTDGVSWSLLTQQTRCIYRQYSGLSYTTCLHEVTARQWRHLMTSLLHLLACPSTASPLVYNTSLNALSVSTTSTVETQITISKLTSSNQLKICLHKR